MSKPKQHEDVVLGSGAGGKLLAWHLARSGRRVAVIERRWVGGSCLNIACLPSKNEIWSAKVADFLNHAARFGIVTGSVAVGMVKVLKRKHDMFEGLVALHRWQRPRLPVSFQGNMPTVQIERPTLVDYLKCTIRSRPHCRSLGPVSLEYHGVMHY